MCKKLLLIDDDIDLVAMNRDLLSNEGYHIRVAFNGEEGLEKIKEDKPDLVILDVMMTTVGEGFEVARQIRENEATRDIPILMLTAVNKEHGFSLVVGPDSAWNPVDGFIDKPVEHQQLLEKVKEMLNQGKNN
jgi:CheY-like chemotaxis protein